MRNPTKVNDLGFYVVAPESQIEKGLFSRFMDKSSVQKKVLRRVNAYEGLKDDWYDEWFQPTLLQIEIGCLSWEEIITTIKLNDSLLGSSLEQFYENCRHFNQ